MNETQTLERDYFGRPDLIASRQQVVGQRRRLPRSVAGAVVQSALVDIDLKILSCAHLYGYGTVWNPLYFGGSSGMGVTKQLHGRSCNVVTVSLVRTVNLDDLRPRMNMW